MDGQIDGQMDGQTDGRTEKVTYRGGCPTWKDGLFDVTMGVCDGAEACELVGTFLLDKINEKYNKNEKVKSLPSDKASAREIPVDILKNSEFCFSY